MGEDMQTACVIVVHDIVPQVANPSCTVAVSSLDPKFIPESVIDALPLYGAFRKATELTGES
jgi:hypothetical protein